MDEDEPARLSRKRRRSGSPSPSPLPHGQEGAEVTQRAPKRLRRSHEVPAYDAPVHASGLSASNPLNRRKLKIAAKKARRAARPRGVEVGGMEVDDVGLGGTFLADDEEL